MHDNEFSVYFNESPPFNIIGSLFVLIVKLIS